MVKLRAFTVIESIISLAIITGTILVLSMVFSNILNGERNKQKLKAQEIIDYYIEGQRIMEDDLYRLEIREEPSENWQKLNMTTLSVFYRGRVILIKRTLNN